MKKIYSVTFCQYTNCMNDTVRRNSDDKFCMDFIHTGRDPFLIPEDKIDYYMGYGGGIKDMNFVGCMEDEGGN